MAIAASSGTASMGGRLRDLRSSKIKSSTGETLAGVSAANARASLKQIK